MQFPYQEPEDAHPDAPTAPIRRIPLVQDSFAVCVSLPPQQPHAGRGAAFKALLPFMHSLPLQAHLPVALEIAGTTNHQYLLLRATSQEALAHLTSQLYARFPQIHLHSLTGAEDPWHLDAQEHCRGVVLRPGAASYQSLRLPFASTGITGSRLQVEAEDDPLLSVLAAMRGLPPDVRVISQLVLQPISPTWSRTSWRKGVEHPLESERRAERSTGKADGRATPPSNGTLVALMLLIGLLLLWYRFGTRLAHLLPMWVLHDMTILLQGSIPTLTFGQLSLLLGAGLGAVLLCVGTMRLIDGLKGSTPLYDMRAIAEKNKQLAYHAQLRVMLIGPADTVAPPESRVLLDRVVAAYRQYHQATGNYFVPHHLSAHACIQLFHAHLSWPLRLLGSLLRWTIRPVGLWLTPLFGLYQSFETLLTGTRNAAVTWVRDWFEQRVPSPPAFVRPLFHFLHAAKRTFFSRIRHLHTSPQRWTRKIQQHALLLSVEEAAALWHVPEVVDRTALAFVPQHLTHTLPVPQVLIDAARSEYQATSTSPVLLGHCTHAGETQHVALPTSLLRENLFVVASTGKGKSTLFTHVALTRLAEMTEMAARGPLLMGSVALPQPSLLVMEPHGDLIEQVLGLIPQSLWPRVTLIDLAAHDRSIGLNPLDMTLGQPRDKAVDDLLTLFKHKWEGAWGPRTENILEYSLRTLADANDALVHAYNDGAARQYTLLDVVPLLRQPSFRHTVFSQCTDTALLDWWEQYYEPLDRRFQIEIISSVVTKLSKYSSTRISRRLLGQAHSTISLREIIAHGGILLVNTASGIVGSDLSSLIGTTLLGLFQAALTEQAVITRTQRQHALVLIDEFQTYHGTNYVTMLTELRKYGGTFGLATQSLTYLDHLDRTLRSVMVGNSDHLYAFEMAADDARLLAPELDGVGVEDLTNLANYTCYAKLSLFGQRLPTFSLELNLPPLLDPLCATQARRFGTQRSTRTVADIETLMQEQQRNRGEQIAAYLAAIKARNVNGADKNAISNAEADNNEADDVRHVDSASKTPRTKRYRGNTKRTTEAAAASPTASPITPLTTPDGSHVLSTPLPLEREDTPWYPADRVEYTGPETERERERW